MPAPEPVRVTQAQGEAETEAPPGEAPTPQTVPEREEHELPDGRYLLAYWSRRGRQDQDR